MTVRMRRRACPLADLDGWQPPCSRDPIAFSSRGYTITHHDPLEFRQLPSVREDDPAVFGLSLAVPLDA